MKIRYGYIIQIETHNHSSRYAPPNEERKFHGFSVKILQAKKLFGQADGGTW